MQHVPSGLFWLCLILASTCLGPKIEALSCPVSSCSPDDPLLPEHWMNTSHSATHIRGLSYIMYPMTKRGTAFTEAQIKIAIAALHELRPFPVSNLQRCDYLTRNPDLSDVSSEVLRQLNWTAMCCESTHTTDFLAPDIERNRTTILATDPLHPSFLLEMEFSTVNQSISFPMAGSANTDWQDYSIDYTTNSTKLTLTIKNWPWVGRDLPDAAGRPSYLKFFFFTEAILDLKGRFKAWDGSLMVHFRAMSSHSYLGVDFLKVYNIDGKDYARSFRPNPDGHGEFDMEGRHPVPAYFDAAFCQDGNIIAENPYWQNMTYDPSLYALFSGGLEEPSPPGTSRNSKKRLHVAAYVVPIVLVSVIIIIVVAVILSPLKIRHFRRLVLGRAAPKVHKLSGT